MARVPPKDHSWCAPLWKVVEGQSGLDAPDDSEEETWAVCLPWSDANKVTKPKLYGTGHQRGNAWKHTRKHHAALKPLGWGRS